MHLATLHTSLLVKTHPSTETAPSSQDQEFWLRIDKRQTLAVGLMSGSREVAEC